MTTIAKSHRIIPESPQHLVAIEALLDKAFGPGRFARTAYRLREGISPLPELSFVAERDGDVIGAVRFSPVVIGDAPVLLLGPLAVHPDYKNQGYGLALMRAGLDAARQRGHCRVMLVGDEPYYARAGLAALPAGQVTMPGPVDPARLLALALVPDAWAGVSGPARPMPAAVP